MGLERNQKRIKSFKYGALAVLWLVCLLLTACGVVRQNDSQADNGLQAPELVQEFEEASSAGISSEDAEVSEEMDAAEVREDAAEDRGDVTEAPKDAEVSGEMDAAEVREDAAEDRGDVTEAPKDAAETPMDAGVQEGGLPDKAQEPQIEESGSYTSRDDVALYLHTYGHLPQNFITKKEAQKLGWQGGGLEDHAPGKCIGGDYFGNYEGLLPEDDNYHECDIDTLGKNSRGAKRIIYSDDGDIYYTADHYASFEKLY